MCAYNMFWPYSPLIPPLNYSQIHFTPLNFVSSIYNPVSPILCCLYTQKVWAVHQNMADMPATIPLKTTESPFSWSHQPSVACQPSPLQARLWLAWCCAYLIQSNTAAISSRVACSCRVQKTLFYPNFSQHLTLKVLQLLVLQWFLSHRDKKFDIGVPCVTDQSTQHLLSALGPVVTFHINLNPL